MPTFKLLFGRHTSGNGVHGTRKVCIPGDILEARSEEEAAFMRKYPDKYEEINTRLVGVRNIPVTAKEEVVEVDLGELERMDAKQLMEFAKANGINTKGAVRREAILDAIKAAIV